MINYDDYDENDDYENDDYENDDYDDYDDYVYIRCGYSI